MREPQRHVVPPDLVGERADRIVAVLLETSRSAARALVDAGDVTVGDAPVLEPMVIIYFMWIKKRLMN